MASWDMIEIVADLVLHYKLLHDVVALPYFATSNYTSETRTDGSVLNDQLNIMKNDFFNRCISCWNYLPPAVVNAYTIVI